MDIFKVLEQFKDDENILFEIIPNKDDIKFNKLKSYISNLKLDESKKRFLLSQIDFQTGNYSIKDLFELIDKYTILIKHSRNPFNNVYPIIIDDKTYINNIALFLACLKLNLHPALIDVECLDDPNFLNVINSKENNFYICSSGTNHKKLVEMNFDEVINTALSDPYSQFEKNKKLFVSVPLKGILGTYINIIYPLIYRCKTVIDTDEDFFNKLINYDINYCYLPNDFNIYLSENLKKYDYGKIDRMFITGSYLSPQMLKLLFKSVKIDLDRIIYMYGSTENNGFVSSNKLSDARVVSLDYNSLIRKKIKKVKFYDLSHLLKLKENKIVAEPLSLSRFYEHSLIYRKFFNNKIFNPVFNYDDGHIIYRIDSNPNPSGLELILSKVLGVEESCDRRLSSRGRIHKIFSSFFIKKDNLCLKHDINFISVGKNIQLKNQFYSDNSDLFFIDKDGHIYMIYRENKDNDLLQKTLFDMFGLPNVIEEDNYFLNVTFEYPEGNYLNEVISFLRYVTRLELREDKIVYAYFDNLTKSKGLKKYISKSEYFSKSFQDYLIRHYERIFLLYIFKGEFNINDLISKINEIELSIKRVDSLSKEELINCLGKYCFNSFVLFYKEDDIHNLNNLLSSNFVLSNNMLILAKKLINKTNELSKLIYDKIEIDEKDLENLYEREMDFVREKRRQK